ncbi:MAG: hypothetical protein IJT18_00110, partial [Oscillospiraceae bacterium]|nr:hypothetical protein [Oscillospiraceae bacterium]
ESKPKEPKRAAHGRQRRSILYLAVLRSFEPAIFRQDKAQNAGNPVGLPAFLMQYWRKRAAQNLQYP